MTSFTPCQFPPPPAYGARAVLRRRGLSMVELMISLAITSMLLVAVATAYAASASAVKMNDDFFHASQTGRITMNQMLTEIRRADSVQCSTSVNSYFDVIRPDETRTTNEVYRRYSFDSANRRVTLQIFYVGGTAGPLYTLANNVESATFGPPQLGADSNNASVVQRLPVTIVVTVAKNSVTLNGSNGPRRALRY